MAGEAPFAGADAPPEALSAARSVAGGVDSRTGGASLAWIGTFAPPADVAVVALERSMRSRGLPRLPRVGSPRSLFVMPGTLAAINLRDEAGSASECMIPPSRRDTYTTVIGTLQVFLKGSRGIIPISKYRPEGRPGRRGVCERCPPYDVPFERDPGSQVCAAAAAVSRNACARIHKRLRRACCSRRAGYPESRASAILPPAAAQLAGGKEAS